MMLPNFEILFNYAISKIIFFLKRKVKENCQDDCLWSEIDNACIGL